MFSFLNPSSPFDPPSRINLYLSSPLKTLIRLFHLLLVSLRSSPTPSKHPIKVVCISDTHTLTQPIPDGDLLVHAGDLTNAGTTTELQTALDWLASLPHAHKVLIAGNHDTYLDPRSRATLPEPDRAGPLDWHDLHYLQHGAETLTFPDRGNRKLRVYGAPQIPACGGPEFAFQYPRGTDAWSDTVPGDVDVLVTHTPPKWHRDLPTGLGCEWLLKEVWRVRPRLHVCGHVHVAAGWEVLWWDEAQRAYERGCERKDGFFRSFVDFLGVGELVRVVVYGVRGVVWDRVWGGEGKSCVLVNAALMYQNTGRLGNEPQVVEI
ncbi:metallophosphoesterase domain-containing protein [Patellaria atrata CBS 101060]|uniref:Metallophosphoesterase domain-containing protein n=1 Tax=Patellaria atrata CBS 101060 TaxID=1346257 RepID=A0A9P4SE56_9PEZI|nr:metallophosphoesterase domain-containing protein [Patellaria atrata CBS 101060]